MKRRVLLVALPLLGVLLGLGLSLFLRSGSNRANSGAVVVIADGVCSSFLLRLQEALEESPDVKVVHHTLIDEVPLKENQSLTGKLQIARQFGAKLLVVGGRNEFRVEILEVDSGALLWRKYWSPQLPLEDVPLVVRAIKKQVR